MPTRLCYIPSMIFPPRTGRMGSWRLQEAVEVYRVPAVVPTLMGGATVLMSVQGEERVRYIRLAPLATMAVSAMGRLIVSVR